MNRIAAALLALFAALLVSTPCVLAAEENDDTTSHDGLELVKQTRHSRLWTRPGATLAPYGRIELLDCAVAFRKSWERDQNRQRDSLTERVTKRDMDRIKAQVARDFRKVFTKELEKHGGYDVIDAGQKTSEGAKDVLVLRPAIIDLDVTSPDVMGAEDETTYSKSAVAMTIYLELYDSTSSQILARYVEARSDSDEVAMMSSSVSNDAVEERILERWAKRLRQGLDDAHAGMAK